MTRNLVWCFDWGLSFRFVCCRAHRSTVAWWKIVVVIMRPWIVLMKKCCTPPSRSSWRPLSFDILRFAYRRILCFAYIFLYEFYSTFSYWLRILAQNISWISIPLCILFFIRGSQNILSACYSIFSFLSSIFLGGLHELKKLCQLFSWSLQFIIIFFFSFFL